MKVEVVGLILSSLLFFSNASDGSGFLPPFLSTSNNGSCDGAMCGKGTCKPSNQSSFPFGFFSFECECDAGWTQLSTDDHFKFLPCVIPNCTMNYSCTGVAPAPAPSLPKIPQNISIFDPCSLAVCGGGECVKTTTFSHRCDCKPGYINLMNNTNFPCFQNCVLNADCSSLGIGLPGQSTPPPAPDPSSTSSACITLTATSGCLLGLLITLVPILF